MNKVKERSENVHHKSLTRCMSDRISANHLQAQPTFIAVFRLALTSSVCIGPISYHFQVKVILVAFKKRDIFLKILANLFSIFSLTVGCVFRDSFLR